MNSAQGNDGGSAQASTSGPRDWGNASWGQGSWGQGSGGQGSWRQGGCGAGRWSPFEIAAVILGFMVFWPIGLAVLGFKLWQRATGYAGDLQTAAAGKWQEARSAMHAQGFGPGFGHRQRRGNGFYGRDSGNAAFDEWRAQEIARLEEERRRLQAAQREFAEFADTIRKAKDREEFERFMNERRNRQAGGAPEGGAPAA